MTTRAAARWPLFVRVVSVEPVVRSERKGGSSRTTESVGGDTATIRHVRASFVTACCSMTSIPD